MKPRKSPKIIRILLKSGNADPFKRQLEYIQIPNVLKMGIQMVLVWNGRMVDILVGFGIVELFGFRMAFEYCVEDPRS